LHYNLSIPGFLVSDDPQSITSIGAIYDPTKWFVLGEWVRTQDDDAGLYFSWYVMGGLRFGKFTPYVDHARAYSAHAGTQGGPPFINQDTSTLGVRWDFMSHVDCKAQLDHTQLHGGTNSYFVNQQPGFRQTGTVNIFSLVVDFVF
jgi:hypothetical protein